MNKITRDQITYSPIGSDSAVNFSPRSLSLSLSLFSDGPAKSEQVMKQEDGEERGRRGQKDSLEREKNLSGKKAEWGVSESEMMCKGYIRRGEQRDGEELEMI